MVMLIADYLETLPTEVKHIWFGEMSKIKIAYFVTRYSIFLHYILTFVYYGSKDLTIPQCHAWFGASIIVLVANAAFSEGEFQHHPFQRCLDTLPKSTALPSSIRHFRKEEMVGNIPNLSMRAYAIKFGLLARYLQKTVIITINLPGMHCTPINFPQTSRYTAALFIVQILALAILIGITFWILRSSYKGVGNSLLVVLIRNGMIYVAIIVVLGIITAAINYYSDSSSLISNFQGAAHPLLSTRLILHLRERGQKQLESTDSQDINNRVREKLETLKFAKQPTTVCSGSAVASGERTADTNNDNTTRPPV
ncbi:hypothetical protein CC1G_14729 [Coprinopsis cinerea okayama7|uniref:DUF6533 domain-containing protein n=1 Tax=Coprinopsis cinerea (strain Okayama-7 / 130 / ATCC MYA-4618 / FGSC 9003) TaxID=240176 RepID=D6RMM0_COPC7|nr:hypothetical protein CC1G_14729 [Coprinopsis cinerea okayama7\|eukprot:XP_002911300.1 hypothetical protein CC1G_14729 [Coprinopsis cinerea okayama7\